MLFAVLDMPRGVSSAALRQGAEKVWKRRASIFSAFLRQAANPKIKR